MSGIYIIRQWHSDQPTRDGYRERGKRRSAGTVDNVARVVYRSLLLNGIALTIFHAAPFPTDSAYVSLPRLTVVAALYPQPV